MTVISSQRYRNEEIIENKVEELKNNNVTSITIPVVNAYTKDLDENDLYIMIDNHHTFEAAKILGITIEFEEVEDEQSYYADIENKNGEAICAAHYMDSNWYYIQHEDDDMYGVEVW